MQFGVSPMNQLVILTLLWLGRDTCKVRAEVYEYWNKARIVGMATALKCSPEDSENLIDPTGKPISCIGVLGSDLGDGARVAMEDCTRGRKNQRWDIFTETSSNVNKLVNVLSKSCLSSEGDAVGAQPMQWLCESGNITRQQAFTEPVQFIEGCQTDWYTYRLRFGFINSTNCLTQQPDGTLDMQPCHPNIAEPNQNFFLQAGGFKDTVEKGLDLRAIIGGGAGAGVFLLIAIFTGFVVWIRGQRRQRYLEVAKDSPNLPSLFGSLTRSSGKGSGSDEASATGIEISSGESSPQKRGQDLLSDAALPPEDITFEYGSDGRPILLGKGAYGKVYVGRWRHKQVAVKMLLEHEEEQQLQFCAEANTLRGLRHPNIVMFLGACLQGHHKMMVVTELCEGGDLAKALLRYQGEPRLIGWYNRGHSILLDVAYGLAYLHSNKICHLDVKPGNVLLDAALLVAKISDVGLSKAILGSCASIATLRGTWQYMAPELLTREHSITFAVDIYAFGVMMNEVITGEAPRRGPLPVPRVPEQCPAAAVELYLRCTDNDPKNRPSAAQLVAAMEALRPGPWGPGSLEV